MWAYNVDAVKIDHRVDRQFRYSDGAEKWLDSGGTLRQFKDGPVGFLTKRHYEAMAGQQEHLR
jgi:hypothetical protein